MLSEDSFSEPIESINQNGSPLVDERFEFMDTSTQTGVDKLKPHYNAPTESVPHDRNNHGMGYDKPWCPPSLGRGLFWNWTKGGETAVQSCPGGATGWVRRKCHESGWAGPVYFGDCRSTWLTALQSRANTKDNVISIAKDLSQVTASNDLYAGDLTTAARLISTLARRMPQDLSDFHEQKQRQAEITDFLNFCLLTASSLLAAGMGGPWGDLALSERRQAVTRLMVGLEEATFLLADALPRDSEAAYFESHVFVSARLVTADGSYVRFPSNQDQTTSWAFADHVILSPEAVVENSERSLTKAVFITYRHLEDLLTPSEDNLGYVSDSNVSRVVNSRIVSASLGHGRHIQLPKPVQIIFSLLRQENMSNPVCVFWDYTTASWSNEGCVVAAHNKSHVTCECDHLTNFAVIMEERPTLTTGEQESPMKVLIYIGCIISLLCLAGSLLMFTIFRGLSSPCSAIHHQMCVCLLVAELVFVLGIWRTDIPVLCSVVAGLLYFAVLAAFTWVTLEGKLFFLCIVVHSRGGYHVGNIIAFMIIFIAMLCLIKFIGLYL